MSLQKHLTVATIKGYCLYLLDSVPTNQIKEKTCDNLNKWRPLSMLSVIYKLASSAIARLKPCLNAIIDTSQNSFALGRYTGECTRIVYDNMKFIEDSNISGKLISIDFEKAFDLISWSFILKTLEYYRFTHKAVKWIKLFKRDIKATIIQCVVLSDFINIEGGVDMANIYLHIFYPIICHIIGITEDCQCCLY